MNKNRFNICPSCMHRITCVLTAQKDLVWSCSEYDEQNSETKLVQPSDMEQKTEEQPPMTLV